MMLLLILASLLSFSLAETQHDPETLLPAPDLIRFWGYTAEEHSATTDDGYILGMHRIPYGIAGPTGGCRPVVFMQHGLEADSTSWTINLPDQSAAYMFADAGFDVWMGNFRGNTYSKKHVNLTSDDEKFWEFTWDDMAQHDLQAMVDYALKVSGQSSLYYIGHSQGTLTMFVKLSSDMAFNAKIKQFYALAPIGSVSHIQGLFWELAHRIDTDAELYYALFGSGEFLANSAVGELLAEWVCGHNEKEEEHCDNLVFQICGPEMTDQFNTSRTEVYFAHNPAGTSTQNILHWIQLVETPNTVLKFDYGTTAANYKHYGQNTPPVYNFTNIATDMYLYWSDSDYLADPEDVQGYLLPALNPTYLKDNHFVAGFSHIDFIWGLRAAAEIYTPILETIKKEMGGTVKC